MPFTLGFDSVAALNDHFRKHGSDFGAVDATDYLSRADVFLGAPLSPTARQCFRRSNADRLRYDLSSEEFGVLSTAGVIRTYYKPDPSKHGLSNNLAYFEAECAK